MSSLVDPSTHATQVPLWRKIVAGILGASGSASLLISAKSNAWVVLIPILALVAAAIVIHRPTLGPQLVARAIWWSNLGLGAILCVIGGSSEREAGVVLTWGCGLALLVISRKGLAEASERAAYAPAAFRTSLLLLMVLALADAQSFFLFGIVAGNHGHGPEGIVLAIGGLAFLIGFVGLFRIRVWGAIVNAITALMFVFLTATKLLNPENEIGSVVLILASVQLIAALPVLLSIFGKVRVLPSTPTRFRGLLANVAVVLVMAFAMVFILRRHT